MPTAFGRKLRYLRTERRMTQGELGGHLRLASHAHVSNLEAGRFEPSLELVLTVARLFGVRLDYLLRDDLPLEAVDLLRVQQSAVDAPALPWFGANLARLRASAGLTQLQLAEQLGLAAHAHVSFLESGKKQPSADLLLRIAERFSVTIDDLFQPPE